MTADPSRPVVPTEKDEAMSLEQQVIAVLNEAFDDVYEDARCAALVIALCRSEIAREIEAERDRYSKTDPHWRAAHENAARIARNGAST